MAEEKGDCNMPTNINDIYITSYAELKQAIEELGFLPLFDCSVPGFSIEGHVANDLWYSSDDGDWKIWDWKGPVINDLHCAYGKFFDKKAVFISKEWFADFANYRRDGYDFDARYEDGLASYKDRQLYQLIDENGPVLSKSLKALGNYRKGGNTGFDTSITRLQAQGYVIISDFRYMVDKKGKEYGWGVAEYSTPEQFLGAAFSDEVYARKPSESYERMLEHLKKILPDADEQTIRKLLR